MLKLPSLDIKGFRGFRHLKIDRLGRVNLIVGKNNSGKSSLLEALRLYAFEGYPPVLLEILESRNEVIDDPQAKSAEIGEMPALWCLFHGYPYALDRAKPIEIGPASAFPVLRIAIDRTLESTRDPSLFDDTTGPFIPALRIDLNGNKRLIPIDELARPYSRRMFLEPVPASRISCVYLSRTGTDRFNRLGRLWDGIALTDMEQEVISGLRLLAPEIMRISMIGDEPRSMRIPVARIMGLERPVPLRNLGDGVNRMFEIVLSIVNARNGLMLIDEMENGLHYSVQPRVWQMLFQLARELDVQVFATSHSWDCVKAFQMASQGEPVDEGVLIRLSKTDEGIIADTFSQAELAIATRDQIEVR